MSAPRPATSNELENLLSSHQLSHWLAPFLAASTACCLLTPQLNDQATTTAPGQSRLGGHPDLGDQPWPCSDSGLPLSFIAQIRLEELQQVIHSPHLPAQGLLSCFCDLLGADPAQLTTQVLHLRTADALTLRQAPKDAQDVYLTDVLPACTLTLSAGLSLPVLPPFDCSAEDGGWYLDQLSVRVNSGMHQFLGTAASLQAPPSPAQRLLLQIDSDPRLDLRLGNQGRLYIWQHSDQTWTHSWGELQE